MLLFVFSICSFGQKIDDIFKTMPDSLLPGLIDGNKTMFLVDTGKVAIPYQLGQIEKLNYSDSYLNIRTSDVGTTQIKLLPLINNSKIICVVKSVCPTSCDSRISFFTTDWQELDKTSLLPTISAESFFDSSKKGSDSYNFALSLPDISPISAIFSDGGDDLTLTFNYSSSLFEEVIEEIKPFIKSDTIVLKWNKTRFQ